MGGRLAMLGGTYDPPHVGHLIVAQDILEGLELDRLLIIPAGDPPHRAAILPTEVRFDLVSQAFGDNSSFEVCREEVDRAGPSFTVDTLQWIRRTLGPAELYCVIGADQLRVIDTWSRYEDIPRLARLAVMARECGVIRETMYDWARRHPEFAEALTWARELSLAWWEEQGQQFLIDRSESEKGSSWSRKMNFGLYKLHMVNRFPQEWRDKQEIAHSHQLDDMSTEELLDLAASLTRKIGGA